MRRKYIIAGRTGTLCYNPPNTPMHSVLEPFVGGFSAMAFSLNHVHLKTPDPKSTADWYVQNLGATVPRSPPRLPTAGSGWTSTACL